MSESKERFVTNGIMDEPFIRAANRQIAKAPYTKVVAIVCGCIIVLCAIALLVMGFLSGMWDIILEAVSRSSVVLLAFLAFRLLIMLIAKWGVNQSIKRIAEENPGCRVEYKVGFAEDGVHLHHVTNGGKVVFAYTNLKRLMSVQDDWVLLTKTNAFFPVFSSRLSKTDQESVLTLLKSNNPKIKIQLPKKK